MMNKKKLVPNLEIHLNQVALEPDGSKRVILVTDQGSSLSRVTLDNLLTGETRQLQALACADFDEWGADKKYYRLDFSNTRVEGSYKVSASTECGVHTSSDSFLIGRNALFNQTMADVFSYFVANRHTDQRDRAIPVIDTGKVVDVFGGWNDAGGDAGKYLSHLTYSNFFTPQQASFVAWSILSAYQLAGAQFEKLKLAPEVLEEAWWGADYLHRVLSDEGYFYMTVFDKWGRDKNRYITGYKGLDGEYTPNYQAAFREGGGIAIAALARAARLAAVLGPGGEFTAEQYRSDAVRAFEHLLTHNIEYCEDGRENIIDDYTALLAAVELFNTTAEHRYLVYARSRSDSLLSRISTTGYFICDDGDRPYYHAVEAGFPLISLLHYYETESDEARQKQLLSAITRSLEYQLQLDSEITNPYDYPRQNIQTYDFHKDRYTSAVLSGFFIPHENETGYWWQGENARLASLAAAATLARNVFLSGKDQSLHKLAQKLEHFIQSKFDWILGKNPFGMCMLFGHGSTNPEYSESGGSMIKGGISNGITGQTDSAQGRGIDFAAGDEHSNWRWVEQWTPHAAWYLYAVSLGVK